MPSEKDLKILIKMLIRKGRDDLAKLFQGCMSEIVESGQYGNHWNSTLSSFRIFAPLDKYYLLKDIVKDDIKLILDSISDIYPPADGIEINDLEYRVLQDDKEDDDSLISVSSSSVPRTFRVFASYSSRDGALAGQLKKELEDFGLEVFLAHEDIEPAADWQSVILANLDSTDIFIPILTDAFKQSDWTDQECGFALDKGKIIIPISVGVTPYGFLKKYQAMKIPDIIRLDGLDIIKAADKARPEMGIIASIVDSVIKSLSASNNFNEAMRRSSLLFHFDNITDKQFKEIKKAEKDNDQIYNSVFASKNLQALYKKHKK